MPKITDKYKNDKLKKLGINIKTTFIDDGKLLPRDTDGSINNNISNAVVYEKEYFYNGKSIHKETEFDTRIEFTYYSDLDESKENTCPNCGYTDKIKEFSNGCPYCGCSYNIDYTDKEVGSKHHYDMVLRSNTYRVVTLIIDVIICMIVSAIFIKSTSRTFNDFDMTKVFVIGIIASLIFYYVFYLMDAYFILGFIKNHKEKINKREKEFWSSTKLDKKRFYNNLNFEIDRVYSNDNSIIDYDIIDYDKFNNYVVNNVQYIELEVYTRVIYFINGEIKSKIISKMFKLKKKSDNVITLKDSINMIKCPGCGSNINVLDGKCSYCNQEIGYIMEWELIK